METKFHYSLKILYLSHNFISNINIFSIDDKHVYYNYEKFNFKELSLAGNFIDINKNESIINSLDNHINKFII